jgi:hypothetical protein
MQSVAEMIAPVSVILSVSEGSHSLRYSSAAPQNDNN